MSCRENTEQIFLLDQRAIQAVCPKINKYFRGRVLYEEEGKKRIVHLYELNKSSLNSVKLIKSELFTVPGFWN